MNRRDIYMKTKVEVGQYWERPNGGPVVKVIMMITDPPEDEPRKAGTIQLKRMDTGFVFWSHELDLRIKCIPIADKDVPLVLLGGY